MFRPCSIIVAASWIVQVAAKFGIHTSTALPIVDLGYSLHRASLDTNSSFYNFTNIRYGEAPVGDLRFAVPILPTRGKRLIEDGGVSPIMCLQASAVWLPTAIGYLLGSDISQLSDAIPTLDSFHFSSVAVPMNGATEDCLFLDVMVPTSIYSARKGKGAPVLVWIHGGGYAVGGKSENGNPAGLLARSQENGGKGVVYVSINYRLGILGWLSGPLFQADGTANLGLYDQRLSLLWVRKNIAKFGGDPNQVTVLGESAGASSIMHHITAYGGHKSRAPFNQAILQSPAFVPVATSAAQEATFQAILQYATRAINSSVTSVSELRKLSSKQIHVVNTAAQALAPFGLFAVGPAIDGTFVPKLPGELLLAGRFHKSIKIMVGHNAKEGDLFTNPFINNETTFEARVKLMFPGAKESVIKEVTKTLYPPLFNGSNGYSTQFERSALVNSEAFFSCNTRYLNLAYGNNTHAYYFAVPPAYHGIDIAHTFYDDRPGKTILGSPVDAAVAKVLQEYITSFAMTGFPNRNASDAPFFPVYGKIAQTQILNLTGLGTQITDPAANRRCDWWQKALYY